MVSPSRPLSFAGVFRRCPLCLIFLALLQVSCDEAAPEGPRPDLVPASPALVLPTPHPAAPAEAATAAAPPKEFLAATAAVAPEPGPTSAPKESEIRLYVATNGKPGWSGRLATPAADGSDGPLPTLAAALEAVTRSRSTLPKTFHVRIVVEEGVYTLAQPVVIGPRAGGEADYLFSEGAADYSDVTIAAAAGAHPVISGGRRITGFQPTEVNGVQAWVATLPALPAPGRWQFRQLWVDGQRRPRTRLPATGYYRVADSGDADSPIFTGKPGAPRDRFTYADQELSPAWHNLNAVEINLVNYWIHARLPIRSVDAAAREVVLAHPCHCSFRDDRTAQGARYYVENVFEALRTPGQWYLDEPAGKLYYIPLPGEDPTRTQVMVAGLPEILRVEGTDKQPVAEVHLSGLTFAYAEQPGSDAADNHYPGASGVDGAVRFIDARACTLEHCQILHVGGYGVACSGRCLDIGILQDRIADTGAGGVKIATGCDRCCVADDDIGPGDCFHHEGIGVVAGACSGTKVIHNRIHGFDSIGVGIGHSWNFAPGECYGNIVEYNDISDLGRGVLSDLAGIHTLGPQVGTRIRYNRVDTVRVNSYGGWGIYLDEGSSGILVENNLCSHCQSGGFFQHFGYDNQIDNNIFAYNAGALELSLPSGRHNSLEFCHNLLYLDGGTVWTGAWKRHHGNLHDNLYFSADGKPLRFCGMDFAQWQRQGQDQGSVMADPQFVDPAHNDFRLKDPAIERRLGFVPFDLSKVGPRAAGTGSSATPAE